MRNKTALKVYARNVDVKFVSSANFQQYSQQYSQHTVEGSNVCPKTIRRKDDKQSQKIAGAS